MFTSILRHFFNLGRRKSIQDLKKMSSISSSSSSSPLLDSIEDVRIDNGRFKYILIDVRDRETNARKTIVRGYKDCKYHVNILNAVENEYYKNAAQLSFDCPGGGRIRHYPEEKRIEVFGYSTGFGLGDHKQACQILKTKYTDYDIKVTNEEY